jgi:DNA helicase-2/ATP-dependent DNA helicase PcrA
MTTTSDDLAPPVHPLADERAETLLADLNPPQRAAVTHRGGPLLVVAGAGSGKTRVLTRRIAWLLAEGAVRPPEVLAITFTNKAAAEMKERVAALVGAPARAMTVSTFHSACVRILRREAKRLGLPSSFSIYDADDSRRLVTMVSRDLDLDAKRFPPRALAGQISNRKNELVDWETARQHAGDVREQTIAEVYAAYQRRLGQAGALDFDDLIMTTVNLLQAFPDVAEHYRRRFRQVLVDEYQDTNHAQYVLVRELVGAPGGPVEPGGLSVVGDADQSIYAFRGATIRNITEFERDYPDATVVLLEQNYRSTQTILSTANAVIAKNPGRKPKRLWSAAGDGERITAYAADNEHDEAAWVAAEIDRLADDEGVRPGDVAVFYRTNAASRALEQQFVLVGLPYKVVGGVRFYERREVRDALAYLRALANPADDVSLRRIVNVPKRGIGDRAVACVAAYAERERISFADGLRRVDEAPGMASRSVNAVHAFVEMLDGLLADAAGGAGPADLLDAVLERTGYRHELAVSTDPQDEGRLDNLAELAGVAGEFEEVQPDGGLAAFLEQVALVADADQIPDAEDGDGVVTLMTLHTAKGLEFPVVFLTGLDDGVLPHQRSLSEPRELAEERRLAYVGITRAQRRLYLTRADSRGQWGAPQPQVPSRFLGDVPAELVDWKEPDRTRAPAGRPSGPGSRAVPAVEAGDKLVHDAWGLGTVISTAGYGENLEATVDFSGDAGIKRLLLRYAPVEKL